jgi:DNA-binding LacI/PurR family transcriptional regulator
METVTREQVATGSRGGDLESYLHSQISNGKLRPGEKLSTVKLAKEWNISEGTVNQSLHILAAKGLLIRKRRAGTFVGESTKGHSAVLQSNNTIAMVLPYLKRPEFSFILDSLQQTAKDSPYTVIAYGTDDASEQYVQVLRDQIHRRVAAIVLVPPILGTLPPDILIELYQSKIPVVTCFRSIEAFGWPLIRTDIVYNTQIAAKHLCEIRRKNIGLVFVDLETLAHRHYSLVTEHAFVETINEFGLQSKRPMCLGLSPVPGCKDERMWLFKAISEIEEWLDEHRDIDGICCMHDQVAWPTLSALAKMGRRVPDDVAVVGNGNMLEYFGFAQSDLTTVDCCYGDFGPAVFKLISDIRLGEYFEPNQKVEIKGKLIVRHSTIGNGGERTTARHFEKEVD